MRATESEDRAANEGSCPPPLPPVCPARRPARRPSGTRARCPPWCPRATLVLPPTATGRGADRAARLTCAGGGDPGCRRRSATVSEGGQFRCRDAGAPGVYSLIVSTLKRIAPIFAVRDLRSSLAHYERLGFATREYEGGGYGFATRDGIEIHLGLVPAGGPRAVRSTA
jgi:hypothetical protein